MRKSFCFTLCLGFRIILIGCLFLLWTSRLGAQGTQSGLGQWEGTVFTPAMDKVTQSAPSVLLLTLRTEGTYDSNVLSSQFAQLSTAYSLLEGQGQYSLQHGSDSFLLTYVGGGRFYPQYSNLNTSIQDARLQWQHNFTKRSKFNITERWASLPEGTVESGNPSQISTLPGTPEFSANFLQQRIQTVGSTLSYQYDLSPHASVIVGGNYDSIQHHGLGLINSKEEDAYGGISFQATRHQSLGLMYAHQWLDNSQGLVSSQVDDLLLTYSNKLTRSLSLSAFGGPSQVSQRPGTATADPSQTNPIPKEQGFVGGAKLEASFGHNKFRAEYTRLVTGGSGFLAAVLRQTSDLNFSRAFSRRLELSIVGIYTRNEHLGATSSSFRTFYVEPSMHYNLTPRLRLSVRGSFGQVQGLAQFGTLARTQVTTQIEYRFRQIPLER